MPLVTVDSILNTDNSLIRLHRNDNVVVARVSVSAGATIEFENREIVIPRSVAAGHKVAVSDISQGAAVFKYGENIGIASADIHVGDLVHVHNLNFNLSDRKFEFATELNDLSDVPLLPEQTFQGYPRADGRVGTRNYVAIIAASNCSAYAVQQVEAAFQNESFGNSGIDGVVCFPHADGCGQVEGRDMQILRRTLGGVGNHPNVAAAVMVGLGCETNQISYYTRSEDVSDTRTSQRGLTLQESGGTRRAVQDSVKAVWELIDETGDIERVDCPASKLVAALECGGSDAFSGVTSNPAVGYFSDLLVKQGGTVCLAETPEICGAEHLLTRRATSKSVGDDLLRMVEWYRNYIAAFPDAPTVGCDIEPGNKAGGLTNIVEKSLGAVAKGGTSNLTAVYDYAERIDQAGFVFMNTPGYDPPSVTGMAAGGCNVCFFTTGRGSCFGFPTVPVIKVASNSKTGSHMEEDMDIDAGVIADGKGTVEEVGAAMYGFALEVASGRKTFSESMGHREFVTWRQGPVL